MLVSYAWLVDYKTDFCFALLESSCFWFHIAAGLLWVNKKIIIKKVMKKNEKKNEKLLEIACIRMLLFFNKIEFK